MVSRSQILDLVVEFHFLYIWIVNLGFCTLVLALNSQLWVLNFGFDVGSPNLGVCTEYSYCVLCVLVVTICVF